MPAKIGRKASQRPASSRRSVTKQSKAGKHTSRTGSSVRKGKPTPASHASRRGSARDLRSRLRLNQERFARLIPISTRSLASIELGGTASESVTRRLTEIRRVVDALAEVIDEEALGAWLLEPNQAFGELKPIEVIERGEVDRIWRMVYLMRSGSAT
jgi:DNA-binding transcriptional regulator YiaG